MVKAQRDPLHHRLRSPMGCSRATGVAYAARRKDCRIQKAPRLPVSLHQRMQLAHEVRILIYCQFTLDAAT